MPQASPQDLKLFLTASDAATQNGVRPDLIESIMQTESGGNPNAVSPKGAMGPMQLMPGTARDLGVDPNDPAQNIQGGTKYYAQLLKHYNGDEEKALTAYHSGMGNVDRGTLGPEGRAYAGKVLGNGQASPDDLKAFLAQPEEKSLGGFANNLLESGGNAISGLANTVMHPVETAKGLGKLGLGTAQELMPEFLREKFGDQRPVAEAAGRHYKNEILHPWESFYKDPVGMASDVAGAASLGGGLAKLAGGVAGRLGFEGAANTARGIGKATDMVNPASLVTKPAERAASSIMGHQVPMSRSFVEQYGMNRGDIGRVMLEKGVNPTNSGLDKLGKLQSAAGNNVRAAEAAIPSMANPSGFTKTAEQLLTKPGIGVQATPAADVSAVQNVVQEFMDQFKAQHALPNGQMATATRKVGASELGEIKRGTYASQPNSVYRQFNTSPASASAQKAIAHDIKDWLETQNPDLGPLNQQSKQLQAVREAVTNKLNTPGAAGGAPGVKTLLDLLAGGQLGNPLYGVGLRLMQSPVAERLGARALYHGAAPVAKGAAVGTAVQRALKQD